MSEAAESAPSGSPGRRSVGAISWLAGLACFAGLTGEPPSARADCTALGIHINQIRYLDTRLPDGGTSRLESFVELYNKGATAVALGGWQITDENRTSREVLPASLVLPGGAFLEIVLGTGADQLDFSNGIGTIFTNGDSVDVFSRAEGAAALYDNVGVIRDFVSWSQTGSAPSGGAVSDAQGAGLWPSGGFVPQSPDQSLFSLRLIPDGFDHDVPSDWVQSGWGESEFGLLDAGANAVQLDPTDGAGLEPGLVTLQWDACAAATSYHLRVIDGAGGAEVDESTQATSATLNLPPGLHRWSVRVVDPCGESAPERFWRFTELSTALSPQARPARGSLPSAAAGSHVPPAQALGAPTALRLGVPQEFQHKDTRLLCVFNIAPDLCCPADSWPGCVEGVGDQGPWDDTHPLDHAEHLVNGQWIQCRHCSEYCARAATQMINAYFGGDLSQDRLSYQQIELGDREWPSPEGDLSGHGNKSSWDLGGKVLQWAVLNSTVTGPILPDYTAIRSEILSGYPVRATYGMGNVIGTHAVVIDGYADQDLLGPGIPPENMLHVQNPWPTDRGIGPRGWLAYSSIPIASWWRIRPNGQQPLAGRMQEPSVTTDTDGDGVMDFDEGNSDFASHGPRAFQARGDRTDTDGDQVWDKQEIRSYTFHALDHPNHPLANPNLLHFIGPDPDHDGLRAERDPDSDNDTWFDGAEDINGNGISPQAGETCVFDPNSHPPFWADKPIYAIPDTVRLNGLLHANSYYNYYVYSQCPIPLPVGAAYTGASRVGVVTTDSNGHLVPIQLTGLSEGCYTVAIDALGDGTYGTIATVPGTTLAVSQSTDPATSFTVASATAVTGAVSEQLELTLDRNPVNGPVALTISVPRTEAARLQILDAAGRLVRTLLDQAARPGVIRLSWDGLGGDGTARPSGVYWARLVTPIGSRSIRFTLLR